jgi:hypothetical protein
MVGLSIKIKIRHLLYLELDYILLKRKREVRNFEKKDWLKLDDEIDQKK